MRKLIVVLLLAFVAIAQVPALTVGDVALSVPVAAKTLLPIALVPEMFSDPNSLPLGIAAIGLYTVPNAALLVGVYSGNERLVRVMRRVTMIADGITTLGLLGFGTYAAVAETGLGGWGDVIAAIYFGLAIPAGIFLGLDFIPFSVERGND